MIRYLKHAIQIPQAKARSNCTNAEKKISFTGYLDKEHQIQKYLVLLLGPR